MSISLVSGYQVRPGIDVINFLLSNILLPKLLSKLHGIIEKAIPPKRATVLPPDTI